MKLTRSRTVAGAQGGGGKSGARRRREAVSSPWRVREGGGSGQEGVETARTMGMDVAKRARGKAQGVKRGQEPQERRCGVCGTCEVWRLTDLGVEEIRHLAGGKETRTLPHFQPASQYPSTVRRAGAGGSSTRGREGWNDGHEKGGEKKKRQGSKGARRESSNDDERQGTYPFLVAILAQPGRRRVLASEMEPLDRPT